MTNPTTLDEILSRTKWNEDGLIPVIAQQYDTGQVLMMAWMNTDAIRETVSTGRVCYWSRSRQKLWRKGESSNQIQQLKSLSFDCDLDTVLLQVDQTGVACHTGRPHCFFYQLDGEQVIPPEPPSISPDILYQKNE